METDYYAVLGVEPEGGEESEVAETTVAEPNGTEAENEETKNTSSTAGAVPLPLEGEGVEGSGDVAPSGDADGGTHGDEGEGGAEKPVQSAEDNARFAAARRKAEAERDAEVARVRKEAKQFADEQIADILQTANFTNPYTGEPIRSMAEFNAYKERLQEEQRGAFKESSGMTDEEYNAFIQSQPEVQKAKEAQKAAEAVIREAREREARAKIDEQLKEITAMNPAITSLADLTKLKSYPELYEKVKRGYSIVDAYKLTNMDDIENRAAQRAQQQTINAVQSKQHLEKTVSRGTGSVEVPADVKAQYQMLNPDMTDAEIQRHYASYASRSN